MNRLKGGALALLAAAGLSAPAAAQNAGYLVPSPPPITDFSLARALGAIKAPQLAGVFAFIAPQHAPLAMADYLMRDKKALKLFVANVGKDFKKARGINHWDKRVLLYLVGLNARKPLPPGVDPVGKKVMKKVNELSLATGMPSQVLMQALAMRGK